MIQKENLLACKTSGQEFSARPTLREKHVYEGEALVERFRMIYIQFFPLGLLKRGGVRSD
jgi:hypothetical protein